MSFGTRPTVSKPGTVFLETIGINGQEVEEQLTEKKEVRTKKNDRKEELLPEPKPQTAPTVLMTGRDFHFLSLQCPTAVQSPGSGSTCAPCTDTSTVHWVTTISLLTRFTSPSLSGH